MVLGVHCIFDDVLRRIHGGAPDHRVLLREHSRSRTQQGRGQNKTLHFLHRVLPLRSRRSLRHRNAAAGCNGCATVSKSFVPAFIPHQKSWFFSEWNLDRQQGYVTTKVTVMNPKSHIRRSSDARRRCRQHPSTLTRSLPVKLGPTPSINGSMSRRTFFTGASVAAGALIAG